ncbi:MAG: LLM class flavin-dependent oxidoreductase [Deltaproteobacteria bacterium]|nr:LLM class flavin-dependent oxidoreductase [Deltaproteobacteria bacterium]
MAIKLSVGFYQSGPISEAVRLAGLAESMGFEGLWLNDAQCRWRDVYVSLGAIAASTSRMVLGPSVTNTLTRHLSVTASAMYSLDELAGGRARMAIGVGDAAVKDIGRRPASLSELAQATEMIRGFWAGEEIPMDSARPRLLYAAKSARSIPIYFAGAGQKLLRLAGQIADGILLNVGAEPGYIQSALAILEEGARSVGRNRGDIVVAARIPTCVSEDPDAKRYVRSRVGVAFLRRIPADLDESDLKAVEKIRRDYTVQDHLRLDAAYAEHVTDSLVGKFALAGRPEECLEKARALANSGIDELNLTFMHPDTESLLRTFVRHIAEKL